MVINFDRNGKLIPDMSMVTLNAKDYPSFRKGESYDTVRNKRKSTASPRRSCR